MLLGTIVAFLLFLPVVALMGPRKSQADSHGAVRFSRPPGRTRISVAPSATLDRSPVRTNGSYVYEPIGLMQIP